jgi:OHCU decarboxylase
MSHDLAWLNTLPADEAEGEFLKCCGSKRWAREMTNKRPYDNLQILTAQADKTWWSLQPSDWLEAFRSHPKIGEKKASSEWSRQEQSGVANASREAIDELSTLNLSYEQKFGFIFIICATGKTSEEMLAALRERLEHEAAVELRIAATEQSKITELRLGKLLSRE